MMHATEVTVIRNRLLVPLQRSYIGVKGHGIQREKVPESSPHDWTTLMERIGFTLRLPAENIAEYTRRHDEIWDELKLAIHAQGGRNYSIFAAPELNLVFGYLEVDDPAAWAKGGNSDITLRWWKYMSDIMPTNDDFSPIQTDLQRVFTLE